MGDIVSRPIPVRTVQELEDELMPSVAPNSSVPVPLPELEELKVLIFRAIDVMSYGRDARSYWRKCNAWKSLL
jgi:hypothetical protein